jgi:preprotein translocase subunit SecD
MHDFPRWKILSVICVCLFFILAALPNILSDDKLDQYPSWLPGGRMNLGLDLQGGSHLLLKVDFDTYLREQLDNLRDEVRLALRKQQIGYRKLVVKGDTVEVDIRPETLPEGPSVEDLIKELDPTLEVEGQEEHYIVRFSPTGLVDKKQQLLEQSITIIDRRINETGTKEPTIQRQGDDRILVQVPGMSDPQQLKNILGTTAKMSFHLVNESVTPDQMRSGIVPPGTRVLPADDNEERLPDGSIARYAVIAKVALSGELLTGANATYSEGQPVVEFTFNAVGARKFGEITQEHIGKRFAVVLDGKVITAPVIRSAILGGRGIIEGNFTVDAANDLAILLRAGALPAPLDIVEERSVGPSLGADSIDAGQRAAMIGALSVMVFMLLYYGLFGIFANLALVVNIVIIIGLLSLLQATLTLPGIAGMVLTMGMAVDANTLIFERIREESRLGKSPRAAIDQGFRSAFGTILDSNLTTLIAAFLLFYFGTGTIKGFAVTLAIGILSSMFTAILLTRLLISVWFNSVRPKKVPL